MRTARLLIAAAAATALLCASATAADAQSRFRHYVALGDSYTSGPFIPIQRLDPLGCGRSTSNYPSFLAAALRVTQFTDRSCGSADTTNMTQPQQVPFLGVNPPQFSGLRSDTDLVTLGIGGNDFGVFGAVVGTCPSLRASNPAGNPCQQHFTSGGVDTVKATIANITPRIVAVLAGIHQRSPGAHVLVIGYPRIVPPSGTCPDVVPLADGDYRWADSVERTLNAAIAKAVATDGHSSFVDTYGPSLGHDACAPKGVAWINGQHTDILAAAAYHPFRTGMIGMAAVILNALRS